MGAKPATSAATCEAMRFCSVVTLSVGKDRKKSLRCLPTQWIGGPFVRRIYLLLTIISGSASAVTVSAARPDALTFQAQTVFQKRAGDKSEDVAQSTAPKSFSYKDKSGQTVS